MGLLQRAGYMMGNTSGRVRIEGDSIFDEPVHLCRLEDVPSLLDTVGPDV